MLDFQGIHEVDDITGQRGGLAVANGFVRQEMRIAVTPRIRHQHSVALGREQRRNFVIAVNVVRPAVQKNHHRTIGRTGFGVRHAQQSGVDMLQRAERRGRRISGSGTGRGGLRGGGRLRVSGAEHAEQGEREDRWANQAAASIAGAVVLQCHLHGDVSVASHWPGGLADLLQTWQAFQRGDVSELCPYRRPDESLCIETGSGYVVIHS
ncbi:hypothetical protein D3C87_1565330 [compost metagenome]